MKNEKMVTREMLVDAHSFFDKESDEFKRKMEVENLLVDIACEFINFRCRNNLTQKELAQRLQITQAMVSKLESGEYNPTIKMLFELAQKLSWSFNIELNNVVQKYHYESTQAEYLLQNITCAEDMGFAV